jgi:multidrug resistance efflux pump
MRTEPIVDLSSVSELRQMLETRPPGIVHGTVFVTAGLLAALVAWTGLTQADLVVRGRAQVRPQGAPLSTFMRESGEVLVAGVGGRVVEVPVRDGAQVKKGDVLLRLDDERLGNEIAGLRRRIDAGREELAAVDRMEKLGGAEFEAARARLLAEEAAASGLRHARERRAAEILTGTLELEAAREEESRVRKMRDGGAAPEADLARATARARQAAAKLEFAQAALEDGRLEVLRRQQVELERSHEVRREELLSRAAAKRGELEAQERALANLEIERDQCVVRAFTDGIVTLAGVRAGDLVQAHEKLAVITRRSGFRVDAAVSVVDVARLRVGMPARVKLDAYEFQRYGVLTGKIAGVSEDAQSTATPAGGHAHFYIVTVELDREVVGRGVESGEIKLGMTGQVEIITGREPLLALLVRRIRLAVSFG